METLEQIITKLFLGIKQVGNALVSLLTYIIYTATGITIPALVIRLVLLALIAFMLYRYSKLMPKAILILAVIVAIAILIGLF